MRRSNGSIHPAARRVAMASMTVLAASGVGLVAAPMAFGQIVIPIGISSQGASVDNSGSASANSGGNTAIGNASSNTATSSAPSGGLVNVPVSLGAPTNNSDGAGAVNTGPAGAVGNSSDTGVGQVSGSGGGQARPVVGAQSAGVTNAGSASANSGGNNAIGNGSRNTATQTQGVNGGLVGVGVGLGGPTNNSNGTATINSGSADAAGNLSSTNVGQTALQGGAPGVGAIGGVGTIGGLGGVSGIGAVSGIGGAGVGAGPCSAGRFVSFQGADVSNRGEAEANTGNNVAIGNASTNDASATVPQTVSGGLLGVGLTIGGPVNNSSGTGVINTGPATAVGNDSTTTVAQFEGCPQVTTFTAGRPPVAIVPVATGRIQQVRNATLARTGLDTGDLGMIAGALLGGGILLIHSQRRRLAARHALARPTGSLGFGLGADDWDRATR